MERGSRCWSGGGGWAAVGGLAHYGRPAGQTLVGTAVVAPRFRKLNSDIVLRAYYAAGLGKPDRADQEVRFGSPMSRDARNTGTQVVVDLPYGKGWSQVAGAREKIASGLDVHVNQVFLTPDKTSSRRHTLFVADRTRWRYRPAERTCWTASRVRSGTRSGSARTSGTRWSRCRCRGPRCWSALSPVRARRSLLGWSLCMPRWTRT